MPCKRFSLCQLVLLSRAAVSKPSGGIRSLHSLSAWGLPTPVVALACIGNVDIQVFSCASGQLYFVRRLQDYLSIIFHVQPVSQGVTLLFFFTEKKKKKQKKKRVRVALVLHYKCITRRLYKEFSAYAKSFIFMWKPLHRLTAVPLVLSGPLCPAGISPPRGESPLSGEAFLPCEFPSTKIPRRGEQAAAAAVTLPFSQLKLGRKVSGDPPLNRNNASSYRIRT